jgi:hypothetical protein
MARNRGNKPVASSPAAAEPIAARRAAATPPAEPRRPNRWLLATSIILFTGWLVFLLVLALFAR